MDRQSCSEPEAGNKQRRRAGLGWSGISVVFKGLSYPQKPEGFRNGARHIFLNDPGTDWKIESGNGTDWKIESGKKRKRKQCLQSKQKWTSAKRWW